MLNVEWRRGDGNDWLKLKDVQPRKIAVSGVYVIWDDRPDGKCVLRVNCGSIRVKLLFEKEMLNTSELVASQTDEGVLCVTWAVVSEENQLGVAGYLSNTLCPSLGVEFRDSPRIPVELPWPPSGE